jgi:hypothetical protein
MDFDWACKEGAAAAAMYPIGVYNTIAVWRPERYLDGKPITRAHHECTAVVGLEFLERA